MKLIKQSDVLIDPEIDYTVTASNGLGLNVRLLITNFDDPVIDHFFDMTPREAAALGAKLIELAMSRLDHEFVIDEVKP